MIVYRITQEPYSNDLSGYGSFLFGGRWNMKGSHMLYTAKNPSLALLETLVHYDGMSLPPNLLLLSIEVIASKVKKANLNDLPEDWRNSPSPVSLKELGSEFMNSGFPVMEVPSVVMPFDLNYLINPNHQGIRKLKIVASNDFLVEGRLLGVHR